MKDVGHKMAKGAAWMVAFKITERSIGLISTVILARLLVPADFGLVALAMAIIGVLELMSAFGFDLALIQNQTARREHYDTAWTFNLIIFAAVALILVALAQPAAAFYEDARLAPIMYWLALGTAILGFENIGVVAFRKELWFGQEFKFLAAKKLSAFAVTVTLALIFRNYWALVAGIITSRLSGVALSYALHPYRPRLSLAARADLLHFSKWMLLSNIIRSLHDSLGNFIIGKMAGAHTLGIFSVSYEISTLPSSELSAPIHRATLPGFAKMSADREVIKKGFLDVLSLTALIGLPAGLGIAAIAEPLVWVMLGAKWVDTIPLISLLAVFGAVALLESNPHYIFIAVGKPKLTGLLTTLQFALKVPVLILALGAFGVIGAGMALLFVQSLMLPLAYGIVMRILELKLRQILKVLWRPLVSAFVMYFAVRALSWPESDQFVEHLVEMIALTGAGFSVYVTLIFALWKFSGSPYGAEQLVLEKMPLPMLKLKREKQ
ncbi:MAG: lipopolysaccharide biosynthesis protein [Burkholderiales bacterium]